MIRENNLKKHLWFVAIIIAVLLAIVCFGCGGGLDEAEKEQKKAEEAVVTSYSRTGTGSYLSTITHDGCEYVIARASSGVAVVHKQNCKFCVEKKVEKK